MRALDPRDASRDGTGQTTTGRGSWGRAVLGEAWEALRFRGARTLLTATGISIAAVILVAVQGLSAGAEVKVQREFDRLRASQMILTYDSNVPPRYIDSQRGERIRRLPGVVAAGLIREPVDLDTPINIGPQRHLGAGIYAMDSQAIAAMRLNVFSGRAFDQGNDRRADDVVMLGIVLARDLLPTGATGVFVPQRIQIAGQWKLVIGIFDTADPVLAASAVVPLSAADQLGLEFKTAQWQVALDPGRGGALLSVVGLSVLPELESAITVLLPFEATELRGRLESTVSRLTMALAAVVGLVGAMIIRNSIQIAVIQRWNEIGVRRALGYSRHAVAGQFIAEGGLLGLFGAGLGVPIGLLICIGYPVATGGVVVIPWLMTILLPVGCALAGVLASVLPARAALRVEPIEALRH